MIHGAIKRPPLFKRIWLRIEKLFLSRSSQPDQRILIDFGGFYATRSIFADNAKAAEFMAKGLIYQELFESLDIDFFGLLELDIESCEVFDPDSHMIVGGFTFYQNERWWSF